MHKAAKTLCCPAGKHTIPVSGITLQKETTPPQEVVRSSLQQLQPTSVGLAAAWSSARSPFFFFWWGNEAMWEMMRWQGPVRENHCEISETGMCSCFFMLETHNLNLRVHDLLTAWMHFHKISSTVLQLFPLECSQPRLRQLKTAGVSRDQRKVSVVLESASNAGPVRFHSFSQKWLRLVLEQLSHQRLPPRQNHSKTNGSSWPLPFWAKQNSSLGKTKTLSFYCLALLKMRI